MRLEARGKLALIVERFVALRILQHEGLLRLLFALGIQPQMCIDVAQLVNPENNSNQRRPHVILISKLARASVPNCSLCRVQR